MDPEVEVIEISPPPPPPPPPSSPSFPINNPRGVGDNYKNKNKNKLLSTPNSHPQAVLHEVIDVDEDEDFINQDDDSMDVIVLDQKVDMRKKGKAKISNDNEFSQSKDALDNCHFGLAEFSAPEHEDPINIDDLLCDDDGDDGYMCFDDLMDLDDYSYLQSHFDNVNIPAGVEAPIPWLPNSSQKEGQGSRGFSPSKNSTMQWNCLNSGSSKPAHVSNNSNTATDSNFQTKVDSTSHDSGVNYSSNLSLSQASWIKNMPTGQQRGVAYNSPPFSSKRTHVVSSSSSHYGPGNQLPNSFSNGAGQPSFFFHSPFSSMYNQGGFGNLNGQGGSGDLQTPGGNIDLPGFHPPVGGPSHTPYVVLQGPWINSNSKPLTSKYAMPFNFNNPLQALPTPPSRNLSRIPRNVDRDAILTKLQLFKQFDTVEDYSDHHYSSRGSSVKQGPKSWVKRITEEWRILQNDLPDSIYVRVYETRMDLMRAVIVGAEGTPYHDGLFFFDILFPGGYPNVPPQVYYHSGGLRLNPNLYNCGKVCLSLLGTWQGSKNEKWLPGVSTVLQVLVSIQALILNQKPFFNEPGYEHRRGTSHGEMQSQQYNEKTFLLSLKTMVYTLRKPLKNFEDFVLGHFHKHAHDILVACRSYINGAQVGSLVKGGVQDVDEGDKSCSKNFRDSLPSYVDILVQEFLLIGVKDCEKYQALDNAGSNPVGNMPKATIRVN